MHMRNIIRNVVWFADAWGGEREDFQEWKDWYDVPYASDELVQEGIRSGCPFKWVIDYIRDVDNDFNH